MNKKILTLLSLLLFSWSPLLLTNSSCTVLPCTIVFPKTVKKIPQICLYQGGERFTSETDKDGKRACFTLPVDKSCTTFALLITDGLQYKSEKNTIQYLKINTKQPYKFYAMELIKAPRKQYRVPSEQKKPVTPDHWVITKEELGSDGRIPDDTIIVLLNSEYVDEVRAEKGFELPTIVIKNDVLAIAGSETQLQDNAIGLLLSSLDLNPLHPIFKTHMRQEQQKIIVALSDT